MTCLGLAAYGALVMEVSRGPSSSPPHPRDRLPSRRRGPGRSPRRLRGHGLGAPRDPGAAAARCAAGTGDRPRGRDHVLARGPGLLRPGPRPTSTATSGSRPRAPSTRRCGSTRSWPWPTSGLAASTPASTTIRRARAALAQGPRPSPDASPRERRRIALRAKQLDAMAALADAASSTRRTRRRSTTRWPRTSTTPSCGCCAATPRRPTAAGRGQRGARLPWRSTQRPSRLSRQRRRPSLPHALLRDDRAVAVALEHGEVYARAGARHPPRPSHVGPRPAARGTDRTTPSPPSEDRRAGERLLRGGEDPRRAGLAPRAQPRPAGHCLPAQGPDAEAEAHDARGQRAQRPPRVHGLPEEGVAGLPARPRPRGRGGGGPREGLRPQPVGGDPGRRSRRARPGPALPQPRGGGARKSSHSRRRRRRPCLRGHAR